MRKTLLSFPFYITLVWWLLILPGYVIWLLFYKHPLADPFFKPAYFRLVGYSFFSGLSLYFCFRIWLNRYERPARMLKEYITGMVLWAGLIFTLVFPLLKIVDNSELILREPVTIKGKLLSITEHGPHVLPFSNELGVIPNTVDGKLDIAEDSYKKGIAFRLSNSDEILTTPFFYNNQFLKDHQERFNRLVDQEILVTYYPISKRIVAVEAAEENGSQGQFLLYDDLYYGKR